MWGSGAGDHDHRRRCRMLQGINEHGVGSRRRNQAMKAVVYTRYGSPDVLRFTEVETPGQHTWMVWKRNLAELLPLLFR